MNSCVATAGAMPGPLSRIASAARRRRFERVAQQIDDRLLELLAIGENANLRVRISQMAHNVEIERQGAARGLGAMQRHQVARQLREIAAPKHGLGQAHDIGEAVDEGSEVPDAVPCDGQRLVDLRGIVSCRAALCRAGEAIAARRAEHRARRVEQRGDRARRVVDFVRNEPDDLLVGRAFAGADLVGDLLDEEKGPSEAAILELGARHPGAPAAGQGDDLHPAGGEAGDGGSEGRRQLGCRAADERLRDHGAAAQQRGCGWIEEVDPALEIEHDDAHRRSSSESALNSATSSSTSR